MATFFQKQLEMFQNANILEHTFFVAKDIINSKKAFASFINLDTFLEYYETIPQIDRHFYEIIRKDYPFYEYYDLDIALAPDSIYTNEMLFDWFTNIRTDFLRLCAPIGSLLLKPNWIILTASNHTKLSLHLINTNAIFTSTDVFKKYYSEFRNYYNSFCINHPFSIDWCVSSNNRMMRIIDSTKLGNNRVLNIWQEFHGKTKISKRQTFITNAHNDKELFYKWITEDMFKEVSLVETKKKIPKIIKVNNEELDTLLSIISKIRCDSYQDWITIGMALKNDNENNLDLWKKWSSQSSKYDENVCDNYWTHFKIDFVKPVTLGTIHYYAKCDNPEKYNQFISKISKVDINLPFTPQLVINHQFIPENFYKTHFDSKVNVIALRSNMFTGKTFSMPTLFSNYSKIVVIYQRISLNISIHEKWKQYGFELYSNIEDYIIRSESHPRVIIQVDSLHRLHGTCDLLILDEIESVHEHLCGTNMNINRNQCWKTLSNYIKYTPKIIACDANLKDETCNLLFSTKNTLKIENKYKSFASLECNIYNVAEKVIEKIFHLLDNGKNIVIPTNSKSRAKKLEKIIAKKYKNVSILRIDSENGFTPIEEWTKYNILIYTPTVTAGVSFDKEHFHSLCGFFTRNSTSCEQSSQMIFRVRKLIDNDIHIYTDNDCKEVSKPIDDISLTDYINNIIRTSHQSLYNDGLDIDRYNMKAKENIYFKLYRLYLKKNHVSFTFFRSYLCQILEQHGITIKYDNQDVENDLDKIKMDIKDASFEIKKEDALQIVNANPITSQEYVKLLNSRKQKNIQEILSIKRYILCSTFDKPPNIVLDVEWVNTNINYMCYKHFKTYSSLNKEQAIEKCNETISRTMKENMEDTMYENRRRKKLLRREDFSSSESDGETEIPYRKKHINNTIQQHIHFDKTNHKILHCLQFIFTAGFGSINDEQKIKIDYNTLHKYCKDNEAVMRSVFGSKIMIWKYELDGNEKKALSKFINQKLEVMLGVRITPTYKGSKIFEINKLFIL